MYNFEIWYPYRICWIIEICIKALTVIPKEPFSCTLTVFSQVILITYNRNNWRVKPGVYNIYVVISKKNKTNKRKTAVIAFSKQASRLSYNFARKQFARTPRQLAAYGPSRAQCGRSSARHPPSCLVPFLKFQLQRLRSFFSCRVTSDIRGE